MQKVVYWFHQDNRRYRLLLKIKLRHVNVVLEEQVPKKIKPLIVLKTNLKVQVSAEGICLKEVVTKRVTKRLNLIFHYFICTAVVTVTTSFYTMAYIHKSIELIY